jgi:tRNA nucleotidyltransferase (CCA-adding enzyme)
LILFDFPKNLNILFDKLVQKGVIPIIVGGYIRDKILNINSIDIDIEVYNVSSFDVLEDILKNFGNVNSVGKSFGVCKLDFEGYQLDFTLPRRDNKVSQGHRGFDIEIDTSLDYKQAANRRDFTINSIGYDIKSKKVLDPYNGIKDLKEKVLRVVDKNQFGEDPLRILRAMQFCARFELKPDKELLKISKDMCEDGVLNELANERIYEEFKKLFLKASKPSIGLKFLKQIGALNYFNELDLYEKDWHFTLDAIDKADKDITVMIAIVCFKMQNTETFITKLTNQKTLTKDIKKFFHVSDFFGAKTTILKYNVIKDINVSKLNKFLKAVNIKEIDSKKLLPKVHGQDLIDAGFKPSKDFSKILQLVYEMQYHFNFNRSLVL